jgi:hypothetical protein
MGKRIHIVEKVEEYASVEGFNYFGSSIGERVR